ncbi:TPA: restriction endonuclease subunit S [Escherichia coli]|nr:restriction endonuclease subunit S [Escherichia coli]HDD0169003.1 restriction endonuclease subunit S [Escherichia coli]
MVPKGWSEHTLDDLALVERGKFSVRPRNDPRYYGGDMPFVQTGDVTSSGTYLKSFSQTLNENGIGVSKVFPKNTILITIAANIGDTAITTFEVACPDSVVAIQPYKHVADVYWLKKYLETRKTDLDAQSTQNAQKNINLQVLKPLLILTPPYAEQKKIAQILLAWDKAISVTEKLLTNSQQQKKALMQQLLTGKKRLLDERGVRFSGEWKRVKLGAIADMNSGGTPKSTVEEYYGGNIPWVSISDMTSNGKWIATTEKYLTELGLNSSSARIYPKNSVLYAMYASIGECSIAAVNLTSSQAILGIRPKDCLNYEFLYFYLTSLKEKIKLQGQQGTQSNLNAGMVKEFELDLPSIREQQKIAAVLSVADAEISTLEKKLACLRDEKKALMQQLLTGKRRVKVDEAVAE